MKKYELRINGNDYEVEIQSLNNGIATVLVNGAAYNVEVLGEEIERVSRHINQPPSSATAPPRPQPVLKPAPLPPRPEPAARTAPASTPTPAPSRNSAASTAVKAGPGDVTAPMPGLILEVKTSEGDMVKTGDVVVRMEAMKMENDILATRDGAISKVHVQQGAEVQSGQVLVTIGE